MKQDIVFGSPPRPIDSPLHAVLHVPLDLLSPIPVHLGEWVLFLDVQYGGLRAFHLNFCLIYGVRGVLMCGFGLLLLFFRGDVDLSV
jgi:hypothetical protein